MNHQAGCRVLQKFPPGYCDCGADAARRNETDRQRMRDKFAAAALTGLCARSPDVPRMYAADAYIIADAMLIARELSK